MYSLYKKLLSEHYLIHVIYNITYGIDIVVCSKYLTETKYRKISYLESQNSSFKNRKKGSHSFFISRHIFLVVLKEPP